MFGRTKVMILVTGQNGRFLVENDGKMNSVGIKTELQFVDTKEKSAHFFQ